MTSRTLHAFALTSYVPKSQQVDDSAKLMARWIYCLKDNKPPPGAGVQHFVERAKGCTFLNPSVTLVPVPRSSVGAQYWPARELCDGLVRAGLAEQTVVAIQRVTSLQPASRSRSDERPTIQQHIESLRVVRPVKGVIVLVDDIITTGTQMAACASLLTSSQCYGFAAGATSSIARENIRVKISWSADDMHAHDTHENDW